MLSNSLEDVYVSYPKERLAVQQIRNKLKCCNIVILSGLRHVGKTVALKQLYKSEENAVYLDCRKQEDLIRFDDITDGREKASLVLLDEYHYHYNCYHFSEEFEDLARVYNFKLVLTSSSVHFCNVIHFMTLGGGRSELVRMPLLTFAEFLYFNGRIPDYHNVSEITEQDFLDYTQYTGELGLPNMTENYIEQLVSDTDTAYDNYPVNYGDLRLTVNDVRNSLSLLSYNLNSNTKREGMYDPKIGGKELSGRDILAFKESEEYNIFSITKAVKNIKKLNIEQITKALYFLLWSNLVVVTARNDEFSMADLPKYYDVDERIFDTLFDKYQFTAVNPLLYTVIVNELKPLTPARLKTVLTSNSLRGLWLEIYLKGSCAYRTPSLVLRSQVCQKPLKSGGNQEIDIKLEADSILLESSVSDKEENRVFFHEFNGQFYRCILATGTKDCVEIMNGISVENIPYYKLAVMVDTGDLFKADRKEQ